MSDFERLLESYAEAAVAFEHGGSIDFVREADGKITDYVSAIEQRAADSDQTISDLLDQCAMLRALWRDAQGYIRVLTGALNDSEQNVSDLLDQCAALRELWRDSNGYARLKVRDANALLVRAETAERERDERHKRCDELMDRMKKAEGTIAWQHSRLVAHETSQVGKMSEEIAGLTHEADTWKQRAETAERERDAAHAHAESRGKVNIEFARLLREANEQLGAVRLLADQRGEAMKLYRQQVSGLVNAHWDADTRAATNQARARLWKRAAREYRAELKYTTSELRRVQVSLGLERYRGRVLAERIEARDEGIAELETERNELRAKLERWETTERVAAPLGGLPYTTQWARVPEEAK
jgi:chromosome segregation ATPase